jgi:hypothetical protein
MSVSRWSGPLIVVGGGPSLPGNSDTNDTPGPSAFSHGVGLLDNRFGPFQGSDITAIEPLWYGNDNIYTIDQIPSTISAVNIAAAQAGVSGTPLTLAGASTGITILAAPLSVIAGQVFPTGTLIIDGNPALITLAQLGGGPSCYDPRTMVARAIRFTSVGNDSTGTVAVVGVDMYGYMIHETVTLANAGIATSKKCYKGIISLTPGGTVSGSNISVGTADVYEFPLAVWEFPLVQIYWAGALISSSAGYTAPVTTSPATAITGDVRGTYATQSASNGTNRLQVFISPVPWNMNVAGLFGVTQF